LVKSIPFSYDLLSEETQIPPSILTINTPNRFARISMMQSVRDSVFHPNLTSMEPDAGTQRQDAKETFLPAKHFKYRRDRMFEVSDEVDVIFGER
jgi:hypothetical protein